MFNLENASTVYDRYILKLNMIFFVFELVVFPNLRKQLENLIFNNVCFGAGIEYITTSFKFSPVLGSV